MNLAERSILVTGASRGIGEAVARRLLDLGAAVTGCGRDFSAWEQTPERFSPTRLDLSQIDDLPPALAAIGRAQPRLDGLVCNAGSGRFGALEEFSFRQIAQSIELNLVQHMFVVKALLPLLKHNAPADIVFLGSESARAGGPKGSLYCAAKFGLRGFAQALRKDCAAARVRVCLINPGMVNTGFFSTLDFRPGRDEDNFLRPSDIAEAVAMVLAAPPGTVFDEINLSPLKKVIDFRAKGDRTGRPARDRPSREP